MIKKMTTGTLLGAATALLLTANTHAGTGKPMKEVVEEVKQSCISGDIGVRAVSQYVSRGLFFENQGAIIQVSQNTYIKLYEGDGFLNKVQLNLGLWSSIHSRHTGEPAGGSNTPGWFEFDFTTGLSFTFLKNFTFTPSYFSFLSPNDAFQTFQGLNLRLQYDTTDLLGFNLAPAFAMLFELENKAGNGPDQGMYYEFSVAPSFPVGPVTVTIPIIAGFGANDFYAGNEGFGFLNSGIAVSYPLSFIPECYGKWTATVGYNFWYLGDGVKNFNTARVRDGGDTEHVFSGGIVMKF